MSAEAFPNEIFADIFSFLSTADLASTSRVSQRLHAITEAILYKNVVLKNTRTTTPPLQIFVHTLLSCPAFRKYVRVLTIDWQRPSVINLNSTHPDHEFQTLESTGNILPLTATVGNLELLRLLQLHDATIQILLHLVPTLQILHFLLPAGHDIFNDFIEEMTDGPINTLPACLRSLRVIHCHCIEGGGVTLKSILAFLLLPSIREIILHIDVCSVLIRDINVDKAYSESCGMSSVTKLNFSCNRIDGQLMKRILAVPRALTHLSYQDHRDGPGSFGSVEFEEALGFVRPTLQYLRLGFEYYDKQYRTGNTGYTIGSLQSWPVLKSLRSSLTILVGMGPEVSVLRLVDVLPLGIRELHVEMDELWTFTQVTDQIVVMLEQKLVSGLGNLAMVTVCAVEEQVEQRLRDACEAAGVQLVADASFN